MALDYGRVYINRGQTGAMRLAVESSPSVDVKEDDLNIFDMMGDRRVSVSGIETILRKVTLKGVRFKSEDDWITCLKNLRYLNKNGTMTLEWAKSDTPTFISFWSDGSTNYSSMDVKYETFKGGEKISPGDQTLFYVRQIVFRQAG